MEDILILAIIKTIACFYYDYHNEYHNCIMIIIIIFQQRFKMLEKKGISLY